MLFINVSYQVSLILTWSTNCAITDKVYWEAGPDNNSAETNARINAIFTIKNKRMYVPFVTLWTQDGNDSLQRLKTGFKRIIIWNKCRLNVSNQKKNKIKVI